VRTHDAPAPVRRPPHGRPRDGARPAVATVLRLQRTIGNRRTTALLRAPRAAHPTAMKTRRGEFPQLSGLHHAGGLSRTEWSDTLKAAKTALAANDTAEAARLYTILYRDAAATARAVMLRDVDNGAPVNLAKNKDEGYKPGLNLVLGGGASKEGSTAFVDASGKFGVAFDAAVKAGTPRIAIRLYSSSFKDDKADTLRVLRHEMLHARHHEQAIDSLKGGNAAPKTAVDKALVSEVKGDGRANTELLAYVEGFMTVFHLMDPPPGPKDPLFIDLLGALDTGTILPWLNASEDVRDEALGRLHEYYCHTLDAKHRAAFDDWVAWLEGQDARAKHNEERMLGHFAAGMREVTKAAC
jgi:hypothetical protein